MEAKNYLSGDIRKILELLDDFTEVKINGGTDFMFTVDYNKGKPYINFIEKKTAERELNSGQRSDI